MKTPNSYASHPIIITLILLYACADSNHDKQAELTELPNTSVDLTSLEAFQTIEDNNWEIVKNLYADRNIRHHFEVEGGSGVLVNLPDEEQRSDLYTNFKHGDIYFETDFMMPKSSNSGLYFQGRYEVQLFDSWGKNQLSFADCGAIYQRWNRETKTGYEGSPPRINASRAPGLWQHLQVRFQAPRFDQNGQKVSNARFLEVYLNGSLVQENYEVTGPTRSAFFDDESALGPLVIQGDHGPVAFKNMEYKLYSQEKIKLADLSYQLYQGQYDVFDTLNSLKPDKTGQTDSVSYLSAGEFDRYAIIFSGKLTAPTEGDYIFKMAGFGPTRLNINNQIISENPQAQNMDEVASGHVYLQAGTHDFELIYVKNNRPWRKGLSFEYEGPGISTTRLHATNSISKPTVVEPILVLAEEKAVIQRGFFMHQDKKHTHTILAGMPEKINYAHRLSDGVLLAGWRGEFADATDMWHARGQEQLASPLGNKVEFSAKPLFSQLDNMQQSWPDSLSLEDPAFRYKGYELSEDGLPIYLYETDLARIKDKIRPDTAQYSLARQIEVDFNSTPTQLYCFLAEGATIDSLPDGSYAIDDKKYYITPVSSGKSRPIIRKDGSRQQLLLPLTADTSPLTIDYKITW